ncbi:hypothetical protein [Anditalea andensis]|uniref:Uncharacterized protein n=1 Tax=Anditalea andensis TaxID=1048983 RepID=A0A074KP99_9BACT|nr:hypothetical protein [Anditalea andensis]KEO71766.1 hypothetical protein EL17_21515 [Anditalea andensis]
MKMPEDRDMEILDGFFAEMKEKDKGLTIPAFLPHKKASNWKLIPIGIAATLLLVIWSRYEEEPVYDLDHDVVIISLDKQPGEEMYIGIQTASSLDIWEAPSTSLLTEF